MMNSNSNEIDPRQLQDDDEGEHEEDNEEAEVNEG